MTLPEGVELVSDGELLIVNVSAQLSEEQLEAELESDAVDEEVAASAGAAPTEEAAASEGDAEEE